MKLVTAEQMRKIEADCAGIGLPPDTLMERAGKAFAEEVKRITGAPEKQDILCLIGPGNNGGDGLVAARYLHEWGFKVSVYLCAQRPSDDENLRLVNERGITMVSGVQERIIAPFDELLDRTTCIIDALFGIGKVRPFQGIYTQVLDRVADVQKKRPAPLVISLDIPSGMDADTGAIDHRTPYADYTVTLGFPKVGLFMFPGAEHVGKLSIVNIGIPSSLAGDVPTDLLTDEWVKRNLPPRPLNANKGTFGKLMVVAGSINYIGAAYLACEGAVRAGAGLVTLATAHSLMPILAGKLTEVTYLPLPEIQDGIIALPSVKILREHSADYDVMLVGCGLGQRPATISLVNSLVVEKKLPKLVLDADGLNALSKSGKWWEKLPGDTILTPHPGEMSRLSGMSIDEIQADRIGTACKMAQKWQKTVVLKGAFSVIAEPNGRAYVSPFANPGLASAGTGDVLAGAIAGLLCQGLTPAHAAATGVYLHGKAGELVRERLGDTGMTASDLLPELPRAIKQIKENSNAPGD